MLFVHGICLVFEKKNEEKFSSFKTVLGQVWVKKFHLLTKFQLVFQIKCMLKHNNFQKLFFDTISITLLFKF